MKSMTVAIMAALCSVFLLVSFHEAQSADYSVTISNDIYKTNNNMGNTCNPVTLIYWSSGIGKKTQLSNALGISKQTLTITGAGSCSSLDLTVTCHYFQTNYYHKGQKSEESWGRWVDESKTQSFTCCHTASIGVALNNLGGNVTNQLLNITCQ